MTLSWDAVSADSTRLSATSYTVQVGGAPGLSNLFNAPVGNVTTVSGTVGAGTYFWRVLASNVGGSSEPSAEATFIVGAGCLPPDRPGNLSVSVRGQIVVLNWSDGGGAPPLTYVIEAGSASGLADLYDAPTASTLTTITASAPPGTYYVRVRARNACGTSGPSNETLVSVQ